MEIERQEYIHIKMHKLEVEKFVLMLEEIDSGNSNLPDWAKAQSIELVRKLNIACNHQ